VCHNYPAMLGTFGDEQDLFLVSNHLFLNPGKTISFP